jgi:hypothetical protein
MDMNPHYAFYVAAPAHHVSVSAPAARTTDHERRSRWYAPAVHHRALISVPEDPGDHTKAIAAIHFRSPALSGLPATVQHRQRA